MYYRYQPYPYYRGYYNVNPYYYRRYYNPYYNIYGGQYANVDQNIINYGDMTDVIQDSVIYQSRSPEPEKKSDPPNLEVIDVSPTTPPESNISVVVN